MSLPNINFNQIRLHPNQPDAFEELCCQLASDEVSPTRVRFDRKGKGGDAGVECYETLADGSEVGWQVKYYWDIGAMLRSLGKSLDTALVKHPKMGKFIACFPFDLPNARVEETTSAFEKWENWRKDRISQATEGGRKIEIDHWDAHGLRNRLTADSPRAAGRVAFWFDQQLFTREWFQTKFERARSSLGERYDPEGNIDLPIGRAIHAVTGDPDLFVELGLLGNAVAAATARAFPIAGTRVEVACDAASSALHDAAQSRIVSIATLSDGC